MSENFPASISLIVNLIQLNKLTGNVITQAIEEDQRNIDLIFQIGLACAKKNKLTDALLIFTYLQSYKNDDLRVFYNLGIIYSMRGEHREALSSYEFALKINPSDIDVLINMGASYNDMNEYIAALEILERAIRITPSIYQAWFNKGISLYELKRYEEAIASYDKAIALNSDYADAWSNKGIAFFQLKRYGEAIASYNKAIALNSDYADAWSNKGIALKDSLSLPEAKESFDRALSLNPDLDNARWARLFISTPTIFQENQDLELLRKSFDLELDELDQWFTAERLEDAYKSVGSTTPFYLAYQEKNNKNLLSKYGAICHRLMSRWQEKNHIYPSALQHSGKIKIGIVSHHIRDHSVWNAITKGLIASINQKKFEIHLFHIGQIFDEETKFAQLSASSYTDNQCSLSAWVNSVLQKEIEVLIYPEIGMEQITIQMASLRLAPIQVAGWGHPETSGIPTVDYYLSADLFESEVSQYAYSEGLINLPNLGCFYTRSLIEASEFKKVNWSLDPNVPILVCPGALYKYMPQNDYVFVEIVKRLSGCKFIFFNQQEDWTEALKVRLKKVFGAEGFNVDDYIIFMPWLKPEEFYGLMSCADVFLDTIGFSGFNTAMQAVECALPIVTIEGQFMRGRLASAILKRMEIPELIAKNNAAYIELAVRLIKDHAYRRQISQKMTNSRNILYDDFEPIYALENFLEGKCRGGAA